MRAVTDAGPVPGQPKSEALENLFTLMKAVSSADTLAHFENAWTAGTIRYGDMKKQLAEDIIAFTNPLREKILSLHADHTLLNKMADMGAEKARESAQKTIREVRSIIGFRK
jgi:tryptophanyl-tRNA synthetase